MPLRIPFINTEKIEKSAEDFLDRHHPSRELPIPIEEIVEQALGIDIVPLPGLQKSYGIDGFTSSNLREITVDQDLLEGRVNRYRFTLAHETGHLVLHSEIHEDQNFTSVVAWTDFIESIPESDWSRLEIQANYFAGFVLAPKAVLVERARQAWATLFPKHGGLMDDPMIACAMLAYTLADDFGISKQALQIRLTASGIVGELSGR